MGILRKTYTMTIRKMIENYKKELRNKMLVQPGEKIRPNCTTYDCPLYVLMVTFNNNSIDVLPDKIVCPKKMCERVNQGMFKCSLNEGMYSVFAGFFVDEEFFSYESMISKDNLPTVQKLLDDPMDESEDKQIETKKVEKKEASKANNDLSTIEGIKKQLILDLDYFLGKEQVKSYTRVKDNTLIFTNPVENDITKINKRVDIDLSNFDYKSTLLDLKYFYEPILKMSAVTTCAGCVNLQEKNNGMAVACSNCSRNSDLALLKETYIPKEDNFSRK